MDRSSIRTTWFLLILLATACVTWFPTWSEPFAEDDYLFLEAVDGAGIGTLLSYFGKEGVMDHHYRPLSDPLFFALLRALFGLNPIGYHVLLTLLHVVTALLVVRLARLLGYGPWAGWVAALLYVTRDFSFPSLVWASGISDIGSATFALASVTLFVRACQRRSRRDHVLSVVFFACAVLTKETAIVVIGLHAVLYLFLSRVSAPAAGRADTADGRAGGVGFLSLIWPYLAVGLPLAFIQFSGARFEEGYGKALYTLEPGSHMFRIWPAYLTWCVVGIRELVGWPGYFALGIVLYIGLVAVLAAGVYAMVTRANDRGVAATALLVLLWFAVAVLPALLAPKRILTNYLAIAAVGPCLGLGVGAVATLSGGRRVRRLGSWVMIILLLVSGPLLVRAKAAGHLASGGWVDGAKARQMDRVLDDLTRRVLPAPAAGGRIVLFGAVHYDLRVLGNPRGDGFGIQQVLASAVRVRYGREDLELLSLPGVAQATPEMLNIVLSLVREQPRSTYVVETLPAVRDLTGRAVAVAGRHGDHRALRRALLAGTG